MTKKGQWVVLPASMALDFEEIRFSSPIAIDAIRFEEGGGDDSDASRFGANEVAIDASPFGGGGDDQSVSSADPHFNCEATTAPAGSEGTTRQDEGAETSEEEGDQNNEGRSSVDPSEASSSRGSGSGPSVSTGQEANGMADGGGNDAGASGAIIQEGGRDEHDFFVCLKS